MSTPIPKSLTPKPKEDVTKEDVKEFDPSGIVPNVSHCCDSAILKDINDCEDESHNEHTIAFTKYTSGATKYISLNISSIFSEDQTKLWSKPQTIINDLILSNVIPEWEIGFP
ncbi:unnamed protein product [Oppiella nova]|uniref:Uncharacterized protein n=1 Tax=Oppiella nova TaxID=334625 RepID=A0A7R9QBI6_9ACAR|nr:unnamed protein product [Oppiella nova]CAG2161921.1 unnamed protein product [Oppiella nova]